MKKITCIIIDDEEHARDRLEALLKMHDDVELIAKIGDPEEAIKEIIFHEPDIVFTDVEMPVKSGFDVVKEVKETGISPKFIFVTAYDQYAIKAIKNAAFDYLLKPIDVDDLSETIERYYGRTQNEQESDQENTEAASSPNLSKREKEIIRLVVQGKTSKEIAEELFISKNTVDTHRRNILEKTGLKSSAELIRYAYEHKLD